MKKILLSATALTALSFSAFAADLPSRQAPQAFAPAPIFTWTGFYVGGTVGAVGLSTNYNIDDYSNQNAKGTGGGALAGLTVGYNYQIGAVVLGAEADYSLSTAGNSASGLNIPGASADMKSFGTLRARVGYTVDRVLVYVTGGLAVANLKGSSFDYYLDSDCRAGFSRTKLGWTLGAGVEYALTSHISLKAEALYADFGKKSAMNSCGCRHSFKNTATVARVGMNYKF